MSILVTGGVGYIGSHMVCELADAGEAVVVLDNLSTRFDWAIAKDVPLIIGDTGDQNSVGQIIREHKVESIIHFAASAIVPDSLRDATSMLPAPIPTAVPGNQPRTQPT
jgi:UDP-glucose 4-epimerase